MNFWILPDGRHRKLLDDEPRDGRLVWRQARTTERVQRVDRHGRARPHDGADDLAPFIVGHADDADLGDMLVLREHVLDLARVEVHAAADDHVL